MGVVQSPLQGSFRYEKWRVSKYLISEAVEGGGWFPVSISLTSIHPYSLHHGEDEPSVLGTTEFFDDYKL